MERSALNKIHLSIVLGFLLSLLFCAQLWSTDHSAPIIGLISFSEPIPFVAVGFFMMLLLGIVFSKPFWKNLAVAFYIILACLDYNFLQPYYYQYVLFLLVLGFKSPNIDKLKALQWIMIGTYVWSGVHKLHPDFIYVFPRIIAYAVNYQDWIASPWAYIAYILPLLELGLGLALMSKRYRNAAFKFLVVMHVWVILNASPLLLDWNYVIIPWNLILIFQLFILFHNDARITLPHHKTTKTMVLLVLILPLFNFIGLWPHYQSFDLYSGKSGFYSPAIDPDCSFNIPSKALGFIEIKNTGPVLHYNQWYEKETGVFPIPENWYYSLVNQELEEEYNCKTR